MAVPWVVSGLGSCSLIHGAVWYVTISRSHSSGLGPCFFHWRWPLHALSPAVHGGVSVSGPAKGLEKWGSRPEGEEVGHLEVGHLVPNAYFMTCYGTA